MMDVREKLVKLMIEAKKADTEDAPFSEFLADFMIANGVTVQEWVSVDDRLPGEKVNCIVHYKHAYCENDDYWAIGICFYDGEKFQLNLAYKVTHWMPLTTPPEGE